MWILIRNLIKFHLILYIKNKNLTFLNQEAIANSFLEKDIDVKFNQQVILLKIKIKDTGKYLVL